MPPPTPQPPDDPQPPLPASSSTTEPAISTNRFRRGKAPQAEVRPAPQIAGKNLPAQDLPVGKSSARPYRVKERPIEYDHRSATRMLPGALKPSDGFTAKQKAFLESFAVLGVVGAACQVADIHRKTHSKWLVKYPAYKEEFARAEACAVDCLETEAIRRAVEGTKEPVFFRGEQCGEVTRYSDKLLQFLLEGGRPLKYRRKIEMSGAGGGPVQMEISSEDRQIALRIAKSRLGRN